MDLKLRCNYQDGGICLFFNLLPSINLYVYFWTNNSLSSIQKIAYMDKKYLEKIIKDAKQTIKELEASGDNLALHHAKSDLIGYENQYAMFLD